jgi:hypothetical protein
MSRYNPEKHRRRSIRLPGWDYRSRGAYFVTIATQGRECLFGEVVDGEMVLSDFGNVVVEEWERTAQLRPYVRLDAFVVMPNHVHGIIWILDNDTTNVVGAAALHPYDDDASNQRSTAFIGGHRAGIQIRGYQTHQSNAGNPRRTRLATELLRAHRAQRTGIERHPPVHPG